MDLHILELNYSNNRNNKNNNIEIHNK